MHYFHGPTEVLEVGEGTGVSSFPSYILAGTC